MKLPYAEDIGHYWQTSQSSPDQWMQKTRKLIENLGGKVIAEGFGATDQTSAYMMAFELTGQKYKVVWPVLPSATGKTLAAKRQAATLLYHDIKAKAMTASVLGTEVAFFSYMVLSDGRTASELTKPELSQSFPLQLKEG
ncbi:hypothetical protein ES705_46239 [subsurface metagenome]